MRIRPIAGIFAALLTALVAAVIGVLVWKGAGTVERITVENPDAQTDGTLDAFLGGSSRRPLRGEDDGRINILLLGRAGDRYPGKNLTDTVMLASIDVPGRRVGFLSLPRDLFAPIPGTGLSTKINSLYQYGIESGSGAKAVTGAVEEITGQPIHYFASLDFDAFESMVDALGGVRIENARDIHDTRYPGPNYSYETFDLAAGWHTLDGTTALKYVRERHDDPEGDFGRARRQQQVLTALRDKALSPATFLNPVAVSRFLDALGDGVRTDLTVAELASLAELAETIDTRNVSSVVIDAWRRESLLRVDHVMVGTVRAFILVPRAGNWNEIRLAAGELFEEDARSKRLAATLAEGASVAVASSATDAAAARDWAERLTDTYGFAQADVFVDSRVSRRDHGSVEDRTGLGKPRSLDALVGVFGLDTVGTDARIPDAVTMKASSFDFLVIFGDNLREASVKRATLEEDSTAADDPFSEYLEPQQQKQEGKDGQ